MMATSNKLATIDERFIIGQSAYRDSLQGSLCLQLRLNRTIRERLCRGKNLTERAVSTLAGGILIGLVLPSENNSPQFPAGHTHEQAVHHAVDTGDFNLSFARLCRRLIPS